MSGSGLIRVTRTSQPQDSAQVADGVAFAWTPSGSLLIPARGQILTQTGAVTLGVGASGRTADMASSAYLERSSYSPITTANGAYTGDFTALVFASAASASVIKCLMSQRESAGNFSQFSIQANADATGNLAAGNVQFATYSGAYTSTAYAGGVDGKHHVYGMRRTGTVLEGWVDGVLVATVTDVARAISDGTAGFGIGSAPPGLNIALAANVALAAGFNYAVRDMTGLTRNPWGYVFAPIQKRIWVPVSAAASIQLMGQACL